MARHRGPVFVDTNAILESFRVDAWRALSGGYDLETVEDCIIETQTGFQRRSSEMQIDEAKLRASLKAVHSVIDRERAALAVRAPDIELDVGERSLWAHAIGRTDAWVLCGPDKASMRAAVRLGFGGQLVDLETLLINVGHRSKKPLRHAYTAAWLNSVRAEFFAEAILGRL